MRKNTGVKSILEMVLAGVLALLCARPAAAQGVSHWTDEFGFGTLSASATAGVTWDDDHDGTPSVFVAGGFTTAGGVPVNRIVKWDGRQWHPLGAGLASSGTFAANSMIVFDDGSGEALYVGGVFNQAGGKPCNCVARWRNGAWEALGAGLGDVPTNLGVKSFAVMKGSLYAGGSFSMAGTPFIIGVARWTGTDWVSVNNGLGQNVECLCAYDDQIDRAGEKLYAGSSANGRVNRLDGATWTSLSVGGGSSPRVTRMAVFNPTFPNGKPQLIVAGKFTTAGGLPRTNIAAWDGATWNDMGGITVTADFPSISALKVITPSVGAPPVLWVGGTITQGGGVPGNYVMNYDGSWHAVTNPATFPYFFESWTPPGENRPTAVLAGGLNSAGLATLESTGWTPLGSAGIYGFSPSVNGLDVARTLENPDQDSLVVAGALAVYPRGATQSVTGVARVQMGFEKTFFEAKVSAGIKVPYSCTLNDTCAIPVFDGGPDRILDSGFFSSPCSGSVLAIVEPDLTSSCIGPVFGAADIRCVRPKHRDEMDSPVLDVVVAGNFQDAGGIPGNSYVGVYDPAAGAWLAPLPIQRPNGPVFAVASGDLNADGLVDVVLGGSFSQTNGTCGPLATDNWCLDLSGVPCITGTGPSGFSSAPLSFTIGGVKTEAVGVPFALYAGGTFTNAGTTVLNYVARWDGAVWQPLGTGMNGVVRALAVWDARDGKGLCLYAGGDFTTAGGVPAPHIARWDGTQWSSVNDPGDPGVNGTVNALKVWNAGDGRGPSLAVGGKFTLAGGLSAGRLARLVGGPNPCPADVDWSGSVDLFDFFQWFNWWDTTDPRAEIDGNPGIDLGDFFGFFASFAVGC